MNLTSLILAAILSLPQPKDPANLPRLAEDIALAAELHDGAPFTGPARVEALSMALVAIAYHESSFRHPVAMCRITGDRLPGQKDNEGRSITAFQLMRGLSWDGHSREDLCYNQSLAAYVAVKVLRRYARPWNWGGLFRGYASGSAGRDSAAARARCKTWERLSVKAGLVVSCWNRADVR